MVSHKSGLTDGRVAAMRWGYVYVIWPGWLSSIPYREEWLKIINEEGEHGQQHGDKTAD
ncbi:hypothetical protein D3C75_700770 [compost metagenome]